MKETGTTLYPDAALSIKTTVLIGFMNLVIKLG